MLAWAADSRGVSGRRAVADAPRKKVGQPPARKVGAGESRKPGARIGGHPNWPGFNFMSLLGWSVLLPTLAGAAFGIWLDERQPGQHSWTLTLLIAGFSAGCFNARYQLAREQRARRAARQMQETAERERAERELAQRESRERGEEAGEARGGNAKDERARRSDPPGEH